MATKKGIKKVVATVRDVTVPQYDATFSCPYCKSLVWECDIEEENITLLTTCSNCKKKFKVKIPKFYGKLL